MVDGDEVHGLDGDRVDPEPVIRAWAVVVRDVQDDVSGLRLELEDLDPDVRLIAAAALVERDLADECVRGVLRDLFDVSSCSEEAHEARCEFGRWLQGPDPPFRRRAIHGLTAGEHASWPWKAAVIRMLDDDDDQTAIDAAVALASMGDTP